MRSLGAALYRSAGLRRPPRAASLYEGAVGGEGANGREYAHGCEPLGRLPRLRPALPSPRAARGRFRLLLALRRRAPPASTQLDRTDARLRARGLRALRR